MPDPTEEARRQAVRRAIEFVEILFLLAFVAMILLLLAGLFQLLF